MPTEPWYGDQPSKVDPHSGAKLGQWEGIGFTADRGTNTPTAPLADVAAETGKLLAECHQVLDNLMGPTPANDSGPDIAPGLDGFTRTNLMAVGALLQRIRALADRIGHL